MDECRSCNAPVLWVQTPDDKWMPVDPSPHDNGNVRLNDTRKKATVLGPLEVEAYDGLLFLSHFATCPQADRWRHR